VLNLPSEKILGQKKVLVNELSSKIKSALTVVFADYRGLTVEQDTELRSALRKAGVEYKVVKNTLTNFAAKENGLDALEPMLKGPTAMAFSTTDVIAPAKVMAEFAKKYEKLELKAGVFEGKVVDISVIKSLADLPSREVLLSQLASSLNATIAGLAIALNAVKEQKEPAEA